MGLVSQARSGTRRPGRPRATARGRAGARREWSLSGLGALSAPTVASANSALPRTHSGSGPSSGRPVKNFAAMQPPWQES
ncbi:Uncharacterised protein [Mycobacteroides abscessus subsp. abscessus]|nr:Uncharacterised protein [Mycobacteroides abscessus subsp. abscessus]